MSSFRHTENLIPCEKREFNKTWFSQMTKLPIIFSCALHLQNVCGHMFVCGCMFLHKMVFCLTELIFDKIIHIYN